MLRFARLWQQIDSPHRSTAMIYLILIVYIYKISQCKYTCKSFSRFGGGYVPTVNISSSLSCRKDEG